MPEVNPPVAFCQLIKDCQRIEVPLIQRDYAQGRESQKDVRNDFLGALYGSLALPAGDSKLPLNLDFVYGSMEAGNEPCFLPLDGQQRLTTLFLLHWYLAWRDGRLPDFKGMLWDGKHSRFTYCVRPSSTEFFDALVVFVPISSPDDVPSVRRMLEDQPWFFMHWRLDPTIQAVLLMLDAIHERFRASGGLYARLVDEKQPAITFHLLPLEHFGLSDDLYIKMNARGKPLTAFETFKARFEELLKRLFPTGVRRIGDTELSVPVFFESQMDAQWTDLFWSHRSDTFDAAAMNLMWALIRISLDPANQSFAIDTTALGEKTLEEGFTTFHDRGWLTTRFADHLMDLLEAWSAGGGKLTPQLPDTSRFDEEAFFHRAITTPWALTYFELVQFAALTFYLTHHRGGVNKGALKEWMRVITNLAANSDIERPEEFARSLAGLQKLVPHSGEILEHLASMDIEQLGFSPQQVREEMLKAKLILSDPGWHARIDAAEEHGYFFGQIEFLLDFSDVSVQADKSGIADWGPKVHAKLQSSFDVYLKKAQITFNKSGLIQEGRSHLWKRALLVVGDYLLPLPGSNYSFLTNPVKDTGSWKRFLRDTNHRRYLKALWDCLDLGAAIEPQLTQIIDGDSAVEPWRAVVVSHPKVIEYCGQQQIRRVAGSNEIYLMSKREMSGYHAELFSYALYLELITDDSRKKLEPLTPDSYQSVYMSYAEPSARLLLKRSTRSIVFDIVSAGGRFQIQVNRANLANDPDVEAYLRDKTGFSEYGEGLIQMSSREEIHETLQQLSRSLAILPQATP